MRLTIVIPALNEEEAIGSTIERCLDARDSIVSGSSVDTVEIIVVSDGSTDRTASIAAGYPDVRVIVFNTNRGYGAAIKAGFEAGSGELVGFLDADGTCDPAFFAQLCHAVIDEHASVAIGSRMGPGSRMPRIRRIGNRVYALMLAALSNRMVSDTASGMRVIRRDALARLYPLPDGLHFTPAMSARVLMDDRLSIVERPMPYEERVGESKLRVLHDGVRFFQTILEMTLMWRPAKVFITGSMLCVGLMTMLAVHPIETWLRSGRLQEDMIYRLLFCSLLGTFGATLLSAGAISQGVSSLLDDRRGGTTFLSFVLDRAYSLAGLGVLTIGCVPLLFWLVGPGIWTRVTSGHVDLHWSRIVLAGLLAFGLGQMLVTVLITNVLRFHANRRAVSRSALASRAVSLPARSLNPASRDATHRPTADDNVTSAR